MRRIQKMLSGSLNICILNGMFHKITPATRYPILITHENERKTLSEMTILHSFNLENIKYLIKYRYKKIVRY